MHSRHLIAACILVASGGDVALAQTPPQVELLAAPRYYGEVRALCVGIDVWQNRDIRGLTYSERDAEEVARVLRERYGFTTKTLVGREATRAAILAEIDGLLAGLGPGDCGVVYVSGHGATKEVIPGFDEPDLYPHHEGFFLPYDTEGDMHGLADVEVYRRTAINMRDLTARVREGAAGAQHVVLILDSCFSGFAAFSGRGGAAARVLLEHPTRQIMTAGSSDQVVYESDALAHGVFTAMLLREIAPYGGSTEILTLGEVYTRTRDAVMDHMESQGGQREMIPVHRHLEDSPGDFVFWPLSIEDDAAAVAAREEALGSARGQQPTSAPGEPGTREAVAPAGVPSFDPAVVSDVELEDVLRQAEGRGPGDPPLLDPGWTGRFRKYRVLAAGGDAQAAAALFYCYDKGLGTLPDPVSARTWGMETADQDRDLGSVVLSEVFQRGIGGPPNQVLARSISSRMSPEFARSPLGQQALAGLAKIDVDVDIGVDLEEVAGILGVIGAGRPATVSASSPLGEVELAIASLRAEVQQRDWKQATLAGKRLGDALKALAKEPAVVGSPDAAEAVKAARKEVSELRHPRGALSSLSPKGVEKRLVQLETSLSKVRAALAAGS